VETYLLFGLGLVVFAVVAYVGHLQAKKRRELFHQFALSQGWTWTAQDDSWAHRFEGDPFGEGDDREAKNILQGEFRGLSMVAFDYSYETHTTDSKGNRQTTTHHYAFCAVALAASLPELELLPEGFFSRIGQALGMQDIELESEDFNRRYRVRCNVPKFASDVLTPRTMEALIHRPPVQLRLRGQHGMCWEDGRHSPAELLARLDTLHAVLDGIPAFVWNDLKGSTP
jgi:hypothetical protein